MLKYWFSPMPFLNWPFVTAGENLTFICVAVIFPRDPNAAIYAATRVETEHIGLLFGHHLATMETHRQHLPSCFRGKLTGIATSTEEVSSISCFFVLSGTFRAHVSYGCFCFLKDQGRRPILSSRGDETATDSNRVCCISLDSFGAKPDGSAVYKYGCGCAMWLTGEQCRVQFTNSQLGYATGIAPTINTIKNGSHRLDNVWMKETSSPVALTWTEFVQKLGC